MSGGHFDIYSAGIAQELYGEWRDLTLGNISESDAIRRIEKLWEDA